MNLAIGINALNAGNQWLGVPSFAVLAIISNSHGVRLEKKMPTGRVVGQLPMDMSMFEPNENQVVQAAPIRPSIILFGNNIMGNFQKVMLFTISMALGMITVLKTLWLCLVNLTVLGLSLSLTNNGFGR